MAIYQIEENGLVALEETTFQAEGIFERRDLQAFLRDEIEALGQGLFVLAEEYGNWEKSRRRIDLLCLDDDGNLVVIELKRTEDGGHMELQAVRYAAMVSKMTFPEAVHAHSEFLKRLGRGSEDAEQNILDHLGWGEPQEENFASDVKLILASAEFSDELITAVMWLNEHDIDIRCIRLKPFRMDNKIILNVEQIIPLPEAADYQIRIRAKERLERQEKSQGRDLTKYRLFIKDREIPNLPKLRLAYHIVRAAVDGGAAPRSVLSGRGCWVSVDGELDRDAFLDMAREHRDEDSPGAKIRDFFTEEDELIKFDGKTFALRSNMWGPNTLPELNRIIDEFDLDDVRFEPEG